jgi:hypothetical protein
MKSLIIIWALVLLAGAGLVGFVNYGTAPAHVYADSAKGQGDCPTAPPFDTTGRCADKCPNPTDNLVGFDKETGVAICNAAPTGCPYGDAVPLGPECDRLAPQQPPQPVDITVGPVAGFTGK